MRWLRSGSTIAVEAPAKLNLFLEIHSKRDDGYHELETLMVAITIHDTLEFHGAAGGQLQLECRWVPGCHARRGASAEEPRSPFGELPVAAENLAYRAALKVRDRAGIQRGARILLHKRVPLAAGMGGASSDAAAALVAANAAWELNWSPATLAALAAELGSDVPFFFAGGAAMCRGRGERIEPLRPVPLFHFVVVRPRDGLATADVYRQCRPPRKPRDATEILEAFRRGDAVPLGRAITEGV
jgi:4-diphosphocytidyl-2-C-methyl-D-erythritol kinase